MGVLHCQAGHDLSKVSSNASPMLTLLYMCQKHSLHSYHRGQNLTLTEFAI